MKVNWLRARGVLIMLVMTLFLPSCGKDDGAEPGDGNGDGEKTVLSAATSDGWTCDFYISDHTGPSCSWHTYDTEAIGDFWIPGGLRIYTHSTPGTECCNSQFKDGTITSKKVDLSGYTTLRFQGHLTLSFQREIGYKACRMVVRLYSNVPNTPDLEILSEEVWSGYGRTLLLEKDIDLSLENAIGYKEAMVAVGARVEGGCGDVNPTDVYAQLANIRIEGK